MRCILLSTIFILSAFAADDQPAVKPPRPPQELVDEFEKTPEIPKAKITPAEKKARSADIAKVKSQIKEGNAKVIETYLNLSAKLRNDKETPCHYKCAQQPQGKVIIIAVNEPCGTRTQANIALVNAGLEVGELLILGCPILKAEVQIVNANGDTGATNLTLLRCKTLATEQATLGEFTFDEFEKFYRSCNMKSISALNLPK